MPITDNPGSPAQNTGEPFAWLETVALIGGVAITAITLWVFWKKGTI